MTKLIVPAVEKEFNGTGGGVVIGLSHAELTTMMRNNGSIKPHEIVRGLVVDNHGTSFYIGKG